MKRFLTLSFLLMVLGANAQTDSVKRETTVVFFGNEPVTQSAKSYNGQAVKLGILEIVSGQYGFYYEKELSDIFSVQLGLGLTGRNFLSGLGMAALEEDDDQSPNFPSPGFSDEPDEIWSYKDRKARIGFFVAAMPKFYLSEDGFDGTYIGFNFQYRKYNMTAYGNLPAGVSETGYSYNAGDLVSGNKDVEEFENQTILAIAWGVQSTNTKTIVDYYVSAGIRSVKGERRDLGYETDPTFVNANKFMVEKRSISQSRFFFEIGLKVGLWWQK